MCEVRHSHEAAVAVPMGKVAQTCLFRRVRSCAHVVWQAWHFVTFHMCEVRDSREAEVALPMGKVAQTFFDVSEDVVTSFCVAGVALCDIPHV